MSILETANWTIEFSWVKAYIATHGKELEDRLVKATARNKDASISYNKISKGTLIIEIENETKQKWHKYGINVRKLL